MRWVEAHFFLLAVSTAVKISGGSLQILPVDDITLFFKLILYITSWFQIYVLLIL